MKHLPDHWGPEPVEEIAVTWESDSERIEALESANEVQAAEARRMSAEIVAMATSIHLLLAGIKAVEAVIINKMPAVDQLAYEVVWKREFEKLGDDG